MNLSEKIEEASNLIFNERNKMTEVLLRWPGEAAGEAAPTTEEKYQVYNFGIVHPLRKRLAGHGIRVDSSPI